MFNKKIILPVIAILIIIIISTIYYYNMNSINSDSTVTVTDMVGRAVTVPIDSNRIIATSPPMTTLVYMLAPDKLIGLNYAWTESELKYVPDKYKNLPIVGGWFGRQDGNYEEILSSSPDIVIEGAMGDVDLALVNERQEKFGVVPVVGVTDNSDVTKLAPSIIFMGKILGSEQRAEKLVQFLNSYLDKVQKVSDSIPDSQKRKVYYAEGPNGLQTDPSGSVHSQLIDIAGGKNVADLPVQDGVGQIEVSMEQVINWNPEVIITTNEEFYKKVYSDSNWANIKAVKEKKVYLAPSSPFNWFDRPPGANIIIGIPWTAKVIYPEKYSDMDLKQITKDYYHDFYNIDLSDDDVVNLLKNSGISNP